MVEIPFDEHNRLGEGGAPNRDRERRDDEQDGEVGGDPSRA